jgi:hypothetical protein
MGSTNGTFINNKKITKHHLKNGDAVVIGKHTLVYLTESARARDPDDFAKTVIISPAAREPMEPRPVPTPAPPVASESPAITVETLNKDAPQPKVERHGALFVLSGVNSGKRIELMKKITNLGRTGKRAGTIAQIGDGYLLTPGDDENPILNGKPIPKEGSRLKNGDLIEVSGTRLQFYLK